MRVSPAMCSMKHTFCPQTSNIIKIYWQKSRSSKLVINHTL